MQLHACQVLPEEPRCSVKKGATRDGSTRRQLGCGQAVRVPPRHPTPRRAPLRYMGEAGCHRRLQLLFRGLLPRFSTALNWPPSVFACAPRDANALLVRTNYNWEAHILL
jgi:hypothetical protein